MFCRARAMDPPIRHREAKSLIGGGPADFRGALFMGAMVEARHKPRTRALPSGSRPNGTTT